MTKSLPLDLARTLHRGGTVDDLAEITGCTAWVRMRADVLGGWARAFTADESCRVAVVELRRAVRALFAYAVRPAPPTRPEADQLLPLAEALDVVNAAASRAPITPRLDWSGDDVPNAVIDTDETDPTILLTAALARATIEFLAGPLRADLRACTGPRCARYFIREHGRQAFCKPSCSNRARAARHYALNGQIAGHDEDSRS